MNLSAALVLLALKGTLNASDRTEFRFTDATGSVPAAIDLQTTPSVQSTLAWPGLNLNLAYYPQLTLHLISEATTLELLHSGRFGISFFDRRYRLSLNQDIRYGGMVFSGILAQSLQSGAAPRVQTLPSADRISILAYQSELSMTSNISRRTAFSGNAIVSGSGGADDISRQSLPSQFGPRISLGISHALSRVSSFQSTAAFSYVAFSTGASYTTLDTRLDGRYLLSRTWTASLGAGVSSNINRVNRDAPHEYVLYPAFDASLGASIPRYRLESLFRARLSPVLDRVRATLDQRLDLGILATLRATPSLSLRSGVDAAQTIPPLTPNALTSLGGELAFSYRPANRIEITLGLRGAWQSIRGQDNPFGAWLIYSNVLYEAPEIRF